MDIPTCVICQDPMLDNLMATTVCGHVYHANCVRGWQTASGKNVATIKCPSCRTASSTVRLRYTINSTKDSIEACEAVALKRRNTILQENVSTLEANLDSYRATKESQEARLRNLDASFSKVTDELNLARAQTAMLQQELIEMRQWKEKNAKVFLLGTVLSEPLLDTGWLKLKDALPREAQESISTMDIFMALQSKVQQQELYLKQSRKIAVEIGKHHGNFSRTMDYHHNNGGTSNTATNLLMGGRLTTGTLLTGSLAGGEFTGTFSKKKRLRPSPSEQMSPSV